MADATAFIRGFMQQALEEFPKADAFTTRRANELIKEAGFSPRPPPAMYLTRAEAIELGLEDVDDPHKMLKVCVMILDKAEETPEG